MNNPKWALAEAITTILDSGVTPTELSHELGFQDTSMVYRYKTGKTKSMGHIKSLVIFNEYDMLLDDYVSADQLKELAQKALDTGGKSIDKCSHLMDKLIIIASYKGQDLRQKLLRFIADNDNRS